MIEFRDVCKTFPGGAEAVKHLSLKVAAGETLILLGTSGCGKTTTLKMINRLIEPTAGEIRVDGQAVMEQDPIALRRAMGYVFQGIGLFPHLTARANASVTLRLLGVDRRQRRRRADELLELVGLPPQEYADRYPHELSGGQCQRIGVARALAGNPKYLLMDEPFGALDAVTRDALQQELLALKGRLQKTIVFVTHDIMEALTLGDRIAVLHEGRLEQIGPRQELVHEPATDFVRDLFRKPLAQVDRVRELLGG